MAIEVEVKVPEVGESISEVEIGSWLKAVGDFVERDEELVVIETEKATVEIVAPQAGRLSKIIKGSGETAQVGEIIGQVEAGAEPHKDGRSETRMGGSVQPPAAKAAAKSARRKEKEQKPEPHVDTVEDGDTETTGYSDDLPESEPGAGERDKVEEQQRQSHAAEELHTRPAVEIAPPPEQEHVPSTAPVGQMSAPEAAAPEVWYSRQADFGREEKIVPMSQLRRRLAERLVQAQQTAALLTTFNEIDMTAVSALRRMHQDDFQARHNIKLGLMSFFVKAAVEALKSIPEVNAEVRDDSIVYRNYFDIGVAVGGGRGLVVPVLRHAERMSFADIEKSIGEFGRRARENKLKPDELQGGTFTITNGGVYGSLLSTPIINPPQSAILGMHAIQERPVSHDGAVAIRPMMYVALTYDHRIIDGREAVTFLKQVKTSVEDPVRMLLEL